jgi:DNA repair protein RadD
MGSWKMLRDYQSEAVKAAIDWMRKCFKPCVLVLATGAGKSHVIAAIADWYIEKTNKRVLVLGPNKEIVEQNYTKFLSTGNPASIYCASLNRKILKHRVIFGSPETVMNSIERFNNFGLVIIDETHGLTNTVKSIIASLKTTDPNLRIVGLTATPYRMGTGYIYGHHYERGIQTEEFAIDPFYESCVYEVPPRFLIDSGFLTPPTTEVSEIQYDTDDLKMGKNGFTSASVDKAFVGQGRKTAQIVADVVAKSYDRKCVMIFAASVKHADEVMQSLPPGISKCVTGKTHSGERSHIINMAKTGKVKYLVSVGALTTGVDIPLVDVVAILRATESASLFQQITGRGLRLCDDKYDCLVLDYAENIKRLCPDGDIFEPEIKARKATESEPMNVCCPLCSHHNTFFARPNPEGYDYTDDGYFADLAGNKIMLDEKELPSHFGRRCNGAILTKGELEQCGYKWSFKECPECHYENDIAARFCTKCREELVDPNEKLKIEAAKIAKDPYAVKFGNVNEMTMTKHLAPKGECIHVKYVTDDVTVSEWLFPEGGSQFLVNKWLSFAEKAYADIPRSNDDAINMTRKRPKEIAYRKMRGTKFHEVVARGF